MAKGDGRVYVLTNEAMPGLVKIGFSMKDPTIRAEDLSKETGIPMPFVVVYKALVVSPRDIEQEVHVNLESNRVNNQREFFRCKPLDAIECIRKNANVKYEVCDEELVRFRIGYEKGTINFKDGGTYIGEYFIFNDGTKDMHGWGTLTFPNGEEYSGVWKDNKRNDSAGFYVWPNGDEYQGGWKDGEQDGQGTYFWSNGDEYYGEWKGGKRNGQGTLTYSNGDEYDGEWKDDKMHGYGIFTYANAHKRNPSNLVWHNSSFEDRYEGEWKNGLKHGKGTLVWLGHEYVNDYGTTHWFNDTEFIAEWNDGKFISRYREKLQADLESNLAKVRAAKKT